MLSRLVCRRNSGANGSRKVASAGKGLGEAFGTRFLFMLPLYHKTNKVVLERSRVDEAVQDALQVEGWELVKLADLFVQQGQDAAAERLMQERSKQTHHTYIPEWLKKHYL